MARYEKAHCIEDFRRIAQSSLPKMVFDFIDGGSGMEATLRENRAALDRVKLVASAPVNVATRDQSVTLFGQTYAMPLVIGPTGLVSVAWPQGELVLARAAGKAGIPYVMSTAASATMEDVARAGDGRKWFQLYAFRDREISKAMVRKAASLDFEVIEIAVDNPIPGTRLRDSRNGFSIPFAWTPRKLWSVATRPGWLWRMMRNGAPKMELLSEAFGLQEAPTIAAVLQKQLDPGVDWDYIRELRDLWPRAFVVKGMLDPSHVEAAVASGVDGVVISNHGGRQLDGAASSIEMLPEFVAAAAGRLTLLIDSGFRTGTDIVKALALGAHSVQVGRPTLFAAASGGQPAVERALAVLRNEIDIAQALLGAATISDLNPSHVRFR